MESLHITRIEFIQWQIIQYLQGHILLSPALCKTWGPQVAQVQGPDISNEWRLWWYLSVGGPPPPGLGTHWSGVTAVELSANFRGSFHNIWRMPLLEPPLWWKRLILYTPLWQCQIVCMRLALVIFAFRGNNCRPKCISAQEQTAISDVWREQKEGLILM